MTASNIETVTVQQALARLATERPWKLTWDPVKAKDRPQLKRLDRTDGPFLVSVTSVALIMENEKDYALMDINPKQFDDGAEWWLGHLKGLCSLAMIEWYSY